MNRLGRFVDVGSYESAASRLAPCCRPAGVGRPRVQFRGDQIPSETRRRRGTESPDGGNRVSVRILFAPRRSGYSVLTHFLRRCVREIHAPRLITEQTDAEFSLHRDSPLSRVRHLRTVPRRRRVSLERLARQAGGSRPAARPRRRPTPESGNAKQACRPSTNAQGAPSVVEGRGGLRGY